MSSGSPSAASVARARPGSTNNSVVTYVQAKISLGHSNTFLDGRYTSRFRFVAVIILLCVQSASKRDIPKILSTASPVMVSKESRGAVLMKLTDMYTRTATVAVTNTALGMAMAQYLTEARGWTEQTTGARVHSSFTDAANVSHYGRAQQVRKGHSRSILARCFRRHDETAPSSQGQLSHCQRLHVHGTIIQSPQQASSQMGELSNWAQTHA